MTATIEERSARPEDAPTIEDPSARPTEVPIIAAGVVIALVGAVLAAGVGILAVAAIGGLLLLGVVALRPQVGAYVLLAATPVIVGMDRGEIVPLLRPNEALLLLVAAALVLRAGVRTVVGEPIRLNVTRVHLAIVAMAVTSSFTPLLWRYSQMREIELDDLLYAVTLWKYFLLFVVIRACVRTSRQVAWSLGLMLASGVVVAVVAVLQAMQFGPALDFVAQFYAPADDPDMVGIGRGTSTVGSSIAVGDVMTFNLVIALAWLHRRGPHRVLLVGLAILFVLGALGSGQFSGAIALVVGAAAVSIVDGNVGKLLKAGIPLVLVAGMLLQPVLTTRLEGFESEEGVPQSWTARAENLEEYFLPDLTADFNWVLGVRASARVPAPEVWREYVFIESGHIWLLWNGGVLFFAAFVAFVWIAARRVVPIARERRDAVGVAAAASAAALAVLFVLMLFDPHLTMRGTADAQFPLLALALTSWGRGPLSASQKDRESSPMGLADSKPSTPAPHQPALSEVSS
jgi:hypothetical protein